MIKKLLSFALICSGIIASAQSYTLTYPFTNVSTTSGTVDPTPTPTVTGITSGSFTAVGTLSVNPNASGRFTFQGLPLGGVNSQTVISSMTGSLNSSVYYEVTLTPQVGYSVSLSSITFTVGRTQQGARSFAVRSSLDNFTNNLPTTSTNTNISTPNNTEFFIVPDAGSTSYYPGSTILGNSTLFVSSPVTFRIYMWNSETSGGAFSLTRVVFTGSVTNTAPCIAPTITSISNAAPICANQDLILQSSASGDTPLTYSWTGTGSFSAASAASTTVTGAASGDYILTVSNTCGTATAAVNATVNPLPSITVNSESICSGGSVTLTATGTAASYTWSTNNNTQSIIVSPTVTTSYSVSATTAQGCVSSSESVATVSVSSSPTLSVNSATICTGQSATLTASGISTYTWSNNSNTASIIVNPTTTTTYTISGEASGCVGTYTNEATVTVNAIPSLSLNASSMTLCAGQSATLTASGATTYTWSTSPAQNTASIIATPSTTTIYSVYGTDLGCVGTTTMSVNVTSLPTVNSTSTTICIGQTATLTASGATTYTWSTSENTASVTLTPSTTTNYTVSGETAGCVKTITTSIIVNALSTISVTSATICAGQTTTLTASGATTYTWSTSPIQNTANAVLTPSSTTIYSVYGTSLNCVNSATTQVVVSSLPVVSANTTSSLICLGQAVTLSGSGADSYSWTGGVTNGAAFSPSVSSTYTVTGTSSVSACNNSAIVSVQVSPCTSINEIENSSSFIVSPNPNNGYFTINSSVYPATLVMYDLTGKQVTSTQITEMETLINVSNLENGVYFINISTENKTLNYKVVITK